MINRLPTQHLEPLVDFNLKKVKSALIARFICSFIESVKHAEAFAVLEIESGDGRLLGSNEWQEKVKIDSNYYVTQSFLAGCSVDSASQGLSW